MGLDAALDLLFTEVEPDMSSISHLLANEIWAESRPHVCPRWYEYFRDKNIRYAEFRRWLCSTIIKSPPSLQERMMMVWHMHFPTSCNGSEYAEHSIDQNIAIRKHCLGDLKELVSSVTYSMAMQTYLNGLANFWFDYRNGVNENHAREFLEIHVLGHSRGSAVDHYTQADVVAIAHAFAGHQDVVNWEPHGDGSDTLLRQRDVSWTGCGAVLREKSIFGQVGPWGPHDVLDLVFTNRTLVVAQWFARHLCGEFVADVGQLSESEIGAVAQLLIDTNFHIGTTMQTRLASRLFYDPRFRMALIRSPAHMWLGTMRLLEAESIDEKELPRNFPTTVLLMQLGRFGHLPYDPPNVSGWRRDREWLTSSDVSRRLAECKRIGLGEKSVHDQESTRNVNAYDPIAVASQFASVDNPLELARSMSIRILGTDSPRFISQIEQALLSSNDQSTSIRAGITLAIASPRYQLF